MSDWLLAVQLVATLTMVGIIWFVQVVHYPLMAWVGPDRFCEYSLLHQTRTTWVVVGPMLLEACTFVALVGLHPTAILSPWHFTAGLLLAAIWGSTFLWQVPLHQRLAAGFDEVLLRRLVRTNWLRTWAWTARAVLLAAALWTAG